MISEITIYSNKIIHSTNLNDYIVKLLHYFRMLKDMRNVLYQTLKC